MKVSAQGVLVTQEGYPILAAEASGLAGVGSSANPALNAPEARRIQLLDASGPVTINEKGEIYVGDRLFSRLSLTEFTNTQGLRKVGGQLFEVHPPSQGINARSTRVHQGVIETSNVNPIEEMTNMIKANRLFEQDLKALKTYGELLGKEANEVGKL
jgi:flagellar basal-body rod protein FlgF